ncbi:MAG TPA: hypothetical protein VJ892_01885 [Candidatus Absconditabacterales bacterium]|nr:hypothetical protein [Candidatus Absconditabacterales bacterium]
MDIVKRSIFGILFVAIISYLVYLLTNGTIIVNENFLDKNNIVYGLYILIFLYYIVFYTIKPTYIKRYKLRNTLLGIFVIVSSQTFLANMGSENIYYADILTVIGVFLTIIGPTNLLISKKLKQEKQEKKMEVIEA